MKLVYPYDGTVFPRGLSRAALDVGSERLRRSDLHRGEVGQLVVHRLPADAGQGSLSDRDDIWKGAASYSDGPADPLVVKHIRPLGGKVLGPVTLTLKFALASLKGAIYYNTYGSMLANNNGAVLKLIPGDAQPTLFLTDNGVRQHRVPAVRVTRCPRTARR